MFLILPQDVNPVFFCCGSYKPICWSERISNNRAVWSSDTETNPKPLGWYLKSQKVKEEKVQITSNCKGRHRIH